VLYLAALKATVVAEMDKAKWRRKVVGSRRILLLTDNRHCDLRAERKTAVGHKWPLCRRKSYNEAPDVCRDLSVRRLVVRRYASILAL
jgi:hypothetical protein